MPFSTDTVLKELSLFNESENLLNEGIDVISIVLQFLYEYGYDDDEIIDTLNEWVERTAKRRDDGYYG